MQEFIQLLWSFLGGFLSRNNVSPPPVKKLVNTNSIPPVPLVIPSVKTSQTNNLPKVYIHRKSTGVQGTPGVLTVANSSFTCETLELMWNNNNSNTSCIPAGSYTCSVSFSHHMQKNLYHILDVPNRTEVMIHNGNEAGQLSKGYKSDVLGCVLLGYTDGTLNGQEAVLNSVAALTKFMSVMKNENFQIEIVNNFEV